MKITISLDREDINTYPLGKNLAVRPEGLGLGQEGMIITFTPEALAELFCDASFVLGGPAVLLMDLPDDQRQRLFDEARGIVQAAQRKKLIDEVTAAGSGGDS